MLWGAEKLVPAEYWCPYGTHNQRLSKPYYFCCYESSFTAKYEFCVIAIEYCNVYSFFSALNDHQQIIDNLKGNVEYCQRRKNIPWRFPFCLISNWKYILFAI